MKNTQLINLLEQLSQEFHTILSEMNEEAQAPDGIIKSIYCTLDKALYNVVNELPMTQAIKMGIDHACQVAVSSFEGSGLDDDLEKVKHLISLYEHSK